MYRDLCRLTGQPQDICCLDCLFSRRGAGKETAVACRAMSMVVLESKAQSWLQIVGPRPAQLT
jgi:hypothetical protein